MYQGRYAIHLTPTTVEHLFDAYTVGEPNHVQEEENWEPEDTLIEMCKDIQGEYVAYALTHLR
jgi:hypothetical protein